MSNSLSELMSIPMSQSDLDANCSESLMVPTLDAWHEYCETMTPPGSDRTYAEVLKRWRRTGELPGAS